MRVRGAEKVTDAHPRCRFGGEISPSSERGHPGVDGRSALARRRRDLYRQLVADLGGEPLPEAKDILAQRAVTLTILCQKAEAEMAAGGAVDIGGYTTGVNALRRLLCDLGLDAAPAT